MKTTLLAAVALAIAAPVAHASPLTRASTTTVKVKSGSLSGSGLYLSIAGKTYVLTSEHVVLHTNASAHHVVRNDAYGNHEARLVAADVGSGLALLEVPGMPPAAEFPLLSDFEMQVPAHGLKVTALGFPLRVSTLASSGKGEVFNPLSDRGALPRVPWMIELNNTWGEYGMSGGPLFSQDTGLVLGVLSHQYVKLEPGKPSEVVEFSPDSKIIANQIICIPASAAADWVRSALDPRFAPYLVRDAAAQRAGKTAYLGYGIRFTPVQGPVGMERPIGGDGVGIGGDGVGVVGGDGIGIGGDAVGIGGVEDLDTAAARASAIRIVLSQDPKTAGWSDASAPGWMLKIRKLIAGVKTLELGAFVHRTSDSSSGEWIALRSAAHFINLLARTDVSPVIQLPLGTGLVPVAVEKAASDLERAWDRLSDSAKLSELGVRLRTISRFAQSAEWAALRDRDFWSVEKHDGWTDLFNTDFDATVELKKTFDVLALVITKNRI